MPHVTFAERLIATHSICVSENKRYQIRSRLLLARAFNCVRPWPKTKESTEIFDIKKTRRRDREQGMSVIVKYNNEVSGSAQQEDNDHRS